VFRNLLVAAVLAAALTACLPPPITDLAPGAPFQPETLTDDQADRYLLAGDLDEATVSAPPTNRGGNTRIVWTVPWTPATSTNGVCATWTSASADTVQQGVVLRWNGTTGVTVSKNVYAGLYPVINVHTWDVSRPVDQGRLTLLTQTPLTGLGWPSATAVPLPWRVCASATAGIVRFKAWPTSTPEPDDSDPCCTGGAPVAITEGRPGWYAGHLRAGQHVTYTDLTTWEN
jgi:hypothetical protein